VCVYVSVHLQGASWVLQRGAWPLLGASLSMTRRTPPGHTLQGTHTHICANTWGSAGPAHSVCAPFRGRDRLCTGWDHERIGYGLSWVPLGCSWRPTGLIQVHLGSAVAVCVLLCVCVCVCVCASAPPGCLMGPPARSLAMPVCPVFAGGMLDVVAGGILGPHGCLLGVTVAPLASPRGSRACLGALQG